MITQVCGHDINFSRIMAISSNYDAPQGEKHKTGLPFLQQYGLIFNDNVVLQFYNTSTNRRDHFMREDMVKIWKDLVDPEPPKTEDLYKGTPLSKCLRCATCGEILDFCECPTEHQTENQHKMRIGGIEVIKDMNPSEPLTQPVKLWPSLYNGISMLLASYFDNNPHLVHYDKKDKDAGN